MRTLDIYTTTNMYNMSDLNRHDVIGLQSVRPAAAHEYYYTNVICEFASEYPFINSLHYVYPSNLENKYLTSYLS